MISRDSYDVAVIGAGAAGCMAAIRAGQLKKRAVLIERNISLGKKILLTGKGRCNITNVAPIETFIEKFGRQGQFFRSAFFSFSNTDLISFIESAGLKLKIERQDRVFPETDSASSALKVLSKSLVEYNVHILYEMRLRDIEVSDSLFVLKFDKKSDIYAHKVVLATGGISYGETGSTGDGFRIAKKLGHNITTLKPALVPLKTKEIWVKRLQGLALKNIRIIYKKGDKKIASPIGEIIFTHFGISGPLVLDLSYDILNCLNENHQTDLFIDLKPALSFEQLENKLISYFKEKSLNFSNMLKSLLPSKLINVFVELSSIPAEKKTHQISRNERHRIINLLKSLPLTITGSLPIEDAMVTGGGISTKEINPKTMESKIIPGLYFAGEIIDGCAPSGGYNLQMAFSTGYLAGEMSA